MEESEGEELASIPGVRIWGPVPETQAVRAGALAAASSVLIAPQVAPAQLYQRLTALVPDEVLPKVGDTAHTLRLRLATSAFLHPSHVLAKGHGRGGRYIELNSTAYPQPRRVQWGEQGGLLSKNRALLSRVLSIYFQCIMVYSCEYTIF